MWGWRRSGDRRGGWRSNVNRGRGGARREDRGLHMGRACHVGRKHGVADLFHVLSVGCKHGVKDLLHVPSGEVGRLHDRYPPLQCRWWSC